MTTAERSPSLAAGVRVDDPDVALLHQLSIGLSAYRLFPGNLEQAAFVAAVERVQAAARRALAATGGPVMAALSGTAFVTRAGQIPHDEIIDRLALACYERRAERIQVRAAPTAEELAALYEGLSMPAEEVAGMGGLDAILHVRGVASVVLGEVGVAAGDGSGIEVPQEERKVWEQLAGLLFQSEDPADEDASADAAARAESLFRQFQQVLAGLPEGLVDDIRVYRKLHEVVASLPSTVRRGLAAKLLDAAGTDVMASRVVGSLTDAELSRLIVDLASEGDADPLEMARSLVEDGGRRESLVPLTAALRDGREEAGTILTGPETEAAELDMSSASETVSDLLARGLVSMVEDDLRDMMAAFPVTQRDHATLALTSLGDYLRLEDDMAPLGQALEVWTEAVRTALRAHEGGEVERLLGPVRAARGAEGSGSEREELIGLHFRRVLDASVVEDLVRSTKDDDIAAAERLLVPFGGEAVDGLMDLLSEESDRSRRALLVGLLVRLAPGHTHRIVQRLRDARWYVVRNAITVLRRSDVPDVVSLLVEASRHGNAKVRKEAVLGLASVAPAEALRVLKSLAGDSDADVRQVVVTAMGGIVAPAATEALVEVARSSGDVEDRRRALDELARHPAPEALAALHRLSGRERP
ncbi:MAG: HEAT repeat domain-containing protein, partial [Actinomycetota bacterium]|nr:HEAT repeat domain-containing protein [Actinomycetota bacterium]